MSFLSFGQNSLPSRHPGVYKWFSAVSPLVVKYAQNHSMSTCWPHYVCIYLRGYVGCTYHYIFLWGRCCSPYVVKWGLLGPLCFACVPLGVPLFSLVGNSRCPHLFPSSSIGGQGYWALCSVPSCSSYYMPCFSVRGMGRSGLLL